MKKGRLSAAVTLVCVFSVAATACGDDDDDGGTPAVGTCDLRMESHSCLELHGASAIDFENQKDGCIENGGAWSTDPCPVNDLVGCCDYTFGNTFHECAYTGVEGDPEALCTGDPVHGVWTPAG